eukprot:534822-Pelagomonas_calceolata.AAC.3
MAFSGSGWLMSVGLQHTAAAAFAKSCCCPRAREAVYRCLSTTGSLATGHSGPPAWSAAMAGIEEPDTAGVRCGNVGMGVGEGEQEEGVQERARVGAGRAAAAPSSEAVPDGWAQFAADMTIVIEGSGGVVRPVLKQH